MKENFTKSLKCCANPEEFPKLAKEMGFSFHLRRGRVNWHKIDTIDVDRLIQERDLATLQENLVNIINYSLDAEYDVKILDPSFVKLFKLAQLSIDYLMYSEQHVYNCVQLAQDEVLKLSAEIQRLQKECRKKDIELRNLKKRVKDLERLRSQDYQPVHVEQATIDTCPRFQCQLCGKVFRTSVFLQLHHERRHVDQSYPAAATILPQETEKLYQEVNELKERLYLTERLLQQEKDTRNKEHNDKRNWEEEHEKKLQMWQECEQGKYREELAVVQKMFLEEIQRVCKNFGATASNSELAEIIQKQDEKLFLLQEQLGKKISPSVEELQAQLVMQEKLWCARLSSLEQQHCTDLQQLAARLAVAEADSTKVVAAYEIKLQDMTHHGYALHSREDEIVKPHISTPARHIVQPSGSQTSIVQSSLRPGGENLASLTPVKPFSPDEIPASAEQPSPSSAVTARMQTVQQDISSSRDSGLDSPKRRAPLIAGTVTDVVTECLASKPEQQTEDSEESEASVSVETSASSESGRQLVEADRAVLAVPSLQVAVELNPNILTELKSDLEKILERRLRELGVDPEWGGVPMATFKHKMSTLQHHQNITAKSYNNFFKLKESLTKEVDRKTAVYSMDATSRRRTGLNIHAKKLTRMIRSVRSKAVGILQCSSQRKYNKTAAKSAFVRTERSKKPSEQASYNPRLQSSSIRGKNIAHRSPLLGHQPSTHQREVPVVTSTPVNTSRVVLSALQTNFMESVDSGKKKDFTPSSSVDDEGSERSDTGPHDGKIMKPQCSSEPVQLTATTDDSFDMKRELFSSLLSATDDKTATSETTLIPGHRSTEASIIVASKQKAIKSVKFSDNVKSSLLKDTDSDSDWGRSSGDGDYLKAVNKLDEKKDVAISQTIRRSMGQSEQTAQICKNIEHQLNVTRRKPVGGVEVMFSTSNVSRSAAAGGETANGKCRDSDWDLKDFDDISSN